MSTSIESLELEIKSNSLSAKKGIDDLTESLRRLKDATKNLGLGGVSGDIKKINNATKEGTSANNSFAKSSINVWAKFRIAANGIKSAYKVIGSCVTKMTSYYETINRFNVSLGEYAVEAKKYGEQVSEAMGIDIAEWMGNQATFMTLAKGFGVVSERAYIMSKNLTQLGYDISSFHDISFEDAMTKLQSGLAGELEPLRRIGYDLSVARLQQEAYTLGINKKMSAMTQAEKAELRYYAIMTQVTDSHGDMARTLSSPANQLRILKSQFTQAARAIGSIFIPMLNAVLPYIIAVTKVVRLLASTIASLFGFELPDVDYSGVNEFSSGVDDLSGSLDDAADNAKKLKKYTMGFDELNVIDPSSGSNGGKGDLGAPGGGGFDFDLPEYDFLKDLSESKVGLIVEDMKEWLGLTEEIDSWADLFDTNLGQILLTVGLIAGGLALWKFSTAFITSIATLKRTLGLLGEAGSKVSTVTLGVILAITGITIEGKAIADGFENGLDGLNFADILLGGGLTVAGGAMIGAAFGAAAIGGAIAAIVASVPALFLGIYDACVNEIDWLSASLITASATALGTGIGALIGAAGGPIGAGIGALIGLAVGLITDVSIWAAQNWDNITKFFTETIPTWFSKIDWHKVGKDLGESVFNMFEKVFKVDIDWGKIGEYIGKGLAEAFKFWAEWLSPMGSAKKVAEWLASIDWKGIFDKVIAFMTKELPRISKEFLSGLGEGLVNGAADLNKNIKEFCSGFIKGFKEGLGIDSSSSNSFIDIGKETVSSFVTGITKFYTDSKESVGTWASSVKEWFTKGEDNSNIWDKFGDYAYETITKFKEKIGSTYTQSKENVRTWASSVKEWFTKGEDNSNIWDKFAGYGSEMITKFKEKIGNTYTQSKTNIRTWASSVKEWFTEGEDGETIFDKFTSYGSTIVSNLSTAIDGGVLLTDYEEIFGRIETALTNVKSNIKGVINSIIGFVESMTNRMIQSLNGMIDGLNALSITIPKGLPNGGTTYGFSIPRLKEIKIPRLMAEGGMVDTGQMFIAREAGPEMVGSIGRRTAVANNDQIVEGIAHGVSAANTESNALLREQNTLLRAMLEKESGVYLDGKSITKSVEKHQRERGRVLVTGGAY